jgi:hypothetical protein
MAKPKHSKTRQFVLLLNEPCDNQNQICQDFECIWNLNVQLLDPHCIWNPARFLNCKTSLDHFLPLENGPFFELCQKTRPFENQAVFKHSKTWSSNQMFNVLTVNDRKLDPFLNGPVFRCPVLQDLSGFLNGASLDCFVIKNILLWPFY